MLADSKTELDASSLLTYRAAWLADQGKRYSQEAAMAKLFASEAATRACNRALQVHGGYGYTREFDVERHLRDAKLCEIGEGTSEVQRMVIAKHVLDALSRPRARRSTAGVRPRHDDRDAVAHAGAARPVARSRLARRLAICIVLRERSSSCT